MSTNQPSGAMSVPDGSIGSDKLEPIHVGMDKRVDLAFSFILVAFGAATIYFATGFRLGSFPDPVTVRGLPYFTGTYMIITGLVLAARRIRTWTHIPGIYTVSEGPVDERGHTVSAWRPFAIMGLVLAWVLTIRLGGYIVVTPVVLFATLWLMQVRSWAKLLGFPFPFTVVTWVAFSQVLGVTLPLGFLAPLARSWGLLM